MRGLPGRLTLFAFDVFVFASSAIFLQAQSVTITSPAASQTISGTSFLFTAAIGNLPNIHSLEYAIDNPGETVCITTTPPFSCNWNSFNSYNSTYHTVIATARDALNNTLAVSTPIPFTSDNWQPEHVAQLTLAITTNQNIASPVSGTLVITPVISGTNLSTAVVSYLIRVDGVFAGGAFGSLNLDTTKFNNGMHAVQVLALDDGNCLCSPTWINGNFDEFSQWEKLVDFENGATAMELRTNAWEAFLCPGGAALCPAAVQLVPTIYNTDESSSAASSPTYASDNTAVATVSAGGLITAVANGSTTITSTSGPFTRKTWVFVNSQNIYPQFGMDSSGNSHLLTAYDPTQSVYVASAFQSCASGLGGFFETNYPPQFSFGLDYISTGWNTCEPPYGGAPANGTSEATFDAAQTALVNSAITQTSPYNLMFLPIGDPLTRGSDPTYISIRGVGSTYTTPAIQYMAQSWAGHRAVASSLGDEINTTWGDLSGGSGLIGTNGFTQIACTAGTTCIISAINLSNYINPGWRFIITGSGDPNLDYNTTSGAPPTYQGTRINVNSFSFPTPASVGTQTYTAATNPGLMLNFFAYNTYDATGHPCPLEGTSAGPCPGYVHNGDFATFNDWLLAPTNHPPIGYSNAAAASITSQTNWGRLSTFASIYSAGGSSQFLAQFISTADLQANTGAVMRGWYGSLNPSAPVIMISDGSNARYNLDGYNVPISSISNNTITFAAPHGLTNILEGNTRLAITGTSLTADNTQMYVIAYPSPTTATVYLRNGQFTESDNPSNVNAVAHFQDGRTLNVFALSATIGGTGPSAATMTLNADTGCTMNTHLGQTVTFTGSGAGSFVGPTFYIPFGDAGICNGAGGSFPMFQLPAGSSTGGTADIQPSNTYVRGINTPQSGNENGPRHEFASGMYVPLLRGAGTRLYILGQNWNGAGATQKLYNATFGSKQVDGVQSGAHPRWDSGGQVLNWQAASLPAKFVQAKYKYIAQPSLRSPDYGRLIECAARQGAYGNILMCQSFSDGPLTRTISLAPYLVTGQAILRYSMTWQGLTIASISPGTASDTATFAPAGFVAYIFPNNAAAEYTPPVFSARLTDVPNAAKIVLHFSYTQQPYTNPNLRALMLPQAVDCSNGTCTLPVDRQMGPVFYQIRYLNSAGTTIAASDIQQW